MESASPPRPFRVFSDDEKKTQPFRAFSDDEKKIIDEFCADLLPELENKPSPLDISDVLERLTSFVTNKVRLVTSLEEPFFSFSAPSATAETPAEVHLPISSKGNERKTTIIGLDTDHRLGDHSGLSDWLRIGRNEYFPLVLRLFRKRYGDDIGKEVIDALFSVLRENGSPVDAEWNQSFDALVSDQGEHGHQLLIEAMGAAVGSSIPQRITKKHLDWGIERAMDACVRVFLRSREARRSFFLLLRNARLFSHASLAESIVRQAHPMFTGMEGMTTNDQWGFHQESMEREAARSRLAFTLLVEKIAGSSGVDMQSIDIVPESEEGYSDGFLEDPFPFPQEYKELPEDILGSEDLAVYQEALKHIAEHEQEERRPLLELLDAKGSRKKMEELRSLHSWDALGAFQRSVLARIYEETIRFPYGISNADQEIVADQSHVSSSPVFAAEERRLNCLTGQWLMTVLAMECGIPYESIAFCNSNLDSSDVAGAHGKIIVALDDGTTVLLDHASKSCLLHLPLAAIESISDQRAFISFFEQRKTDAKSGVKWVGDPVHVRVSAETSDIFSLPEDFHVVCPDQAFTARSLFNVGIALEREGKTEEAKHAYEIALVTEPTNADILTRLGALALEREDSMNAHRYLLAALKSNKFHVYAWYYSALHHAKQGRPDDALRHLQILSTDDRKVWGDADFQVRVDALIALMMKQKEALQELESLQEDVVEKRQTLTDDVPIAAIRVTHS